MQRLDWYLHRLRGMSVGEITWRARATCREALDRCRVGIGWRPRLDAAWLAAATHSHPPLRLTDVQPGDWKDSPAGSVEASWRDRLLSRAEKIVAHRLSFFELHDHHLGDPIDWNRDHASGRPAPMRFAPASTIATIGSRATPSWSGSQTDITSSSPLGAPTARRAKSAMPPPSSNNCNPGWSSVPTAWG